MTNIKFLLIGTSLSFIPTITFAQCVATQDCETLGYTETSCNGGKGVKCPFGNKWACLSTKDAICKEEGFTLACNETGQTGGGDSCNGLYKKCICNSSYKYTCYGTGYSGGSGAACGGKYTKCSCSSPYTWTSGACKCPSTYQYTCSGTNQTGGSGTACGGKYTACTCASGYEWKDGSCQINPCTNQSNGAYSEVYCCNGTVVGVKATGMNFYIAMKDLGRMTLTSAESQCSSHVFCDSLKGTLPSKDQLVTIYNNKSQVNTLLETSGGTQLTNYYYWTSTCSGGTNYYIVSMSNGIVNNTYYTSYDSYVRPVLTSW